MTKGDRFERLALAVIGIGILLWIGPAVEHFQINRAIDNYDVRETMDVRSVGVGDSVFGDPVILAVDREVHQPFHGSYVVEVRTFPHRTIVCTASDSLLYDPDAQMPEPITLLWWANDECSGTDLVKGEYIIITSWVVQNDLDYVPDQKITVESNKFTVKGVAADVAATAIEKQIIMQDEQRALQETVRDLTDQLNQLKVAE